MFGLGKKHIKHVKGSKGKHSRFGDDLADLEPPTSLDVDIETIDSDDAVGEMGTPGEDYGRGDAGCSPDNQLSNSNGGLDPFAVASFGFGADDVYDGTMPPEYSLDEFTDDLPEAYQPAGPDDFNFPEQVATLRNPIVDFGREFGSCGSLKK